MSSKNERNELNDSAVEYTSNSPVVQYIEKVAALVKVRVDTRKCDGEGLCAELCPVDVFEMQSSNSTKKSTPVREENCILCMICEVNCPTKAVTVAG